LQKYTIDPNSTETQCVGEIPAVVLKKYNIQCPSPEVKMYPGAIKHIKKKHATVFGLYYEKIPDIICNPDYVGQNPKEPQSIEMYKYVGDNLLVAIKLDPSGYFYLSTFYDLNNGNTKIHKRLKSGRIVPFSQLS
jgi:hypothetical protein